MKTGSYNYDYTDKVIRYLDEFLIEQFSKLKSLVSYDEINALESVNTVYRTIDREVRKRFVKLARMSYQQIRNRDLQSLDEEWVDALLEGFDPVMDYIYSNEFDRKRSRLFEALVSSDDKAKPVQTALKQLAFQIRNFAVRVTDEAVKKAMKDQKTTIVEWVAELDAKTCDYCYILDGQRFPLAKVPEKPHPNCRCTLKVVTTLGNH